MLSPTHLGVDAQSGVMLHTFSQRDVYQQNTHFEAPRQYKLSFHNKLDIFWKVVQHK